MKAEIIKNKFINFFKKNNYIELNESPLIPKNDESLLFTNSGMVQFKNIFLGIEKSEHKRVTTIQTCVRLGGKHNDLNNIGKTPHHNTSFEMLGNFGLDNISKEETIKLAWDFLTTELNLNKEKIYTTIHKKDNETKNIWKNVIKFDETRIIDGNDETNFWSMDETGPCGYCNEIFYNIGKNEKNLLEIWNLVFIQFNKNKNDLTKLNSSYIDTGMGLERISSIKQKTYDSFKTDIYQPLIESLLKTFNISTNDLNENIKIIVDHVKTCILLIKEGITPSNDGRGYILKKLIRRSIIKKQHLKTKAFLYELTDDFVKHLNKKNSYTKQDNIIIKEILKQEEHKFTQTIKNGTKFIKKLTKNNKNIDGKTIFMLYDTYGIPLDTIKNITEKKNITLNTDDFKTEMDRQKIKSKKIKSKISIDLEQTKNTPKTNFTGYTSNTVPAAIIKIIKNNKASKNILENEAGIIIIDKTCFYSEKGGQVGDIGTISNNTNVFEVTDTKEINNIYFHYGKMTHGELNINDTVLAQIDIENRNSISSNHSATHLLHATLKEHLGQHIKQAGSLINNNYLRFDFIHFNSLSKEDLNKIEKTINQHIKNNLNVNTTIDISNGKNTKNAIEIRNVIIGTNISNELCAGTHVKNTGEIGVFKIIKEFGIGTNIRRIEAITGDKIINILNENESLIEQITQKFKTNKQNLIQSCNNLIQKNKNLENENETLLLNNIKNDIKNSNALKTHNNINIISINLNKKHINAIKQITHTLEKTILLIYSHEHTAVNIQINISKDLIHLNAINIIEYLKQYIDIKGGGKNISATGIINNYQKDTKYISNHIYSYIDTILN